MLYLFPLLLHCFCYSAVAFLGNSTAPIPLSLPVTAQPLTALVCKTAPPRTFLHGLRFSPSHSLISHYFIFCATGVSSNVGTVEENVSKRQRHRDPKTQQGEQRLGSKIFVCVVHDAWDNDRVVFDFVLQTSNCSDYEFLELTFCRQQILHMEMAPNSSTSRLVP